MPELWHLGNDIVDLARPRAKGKAGDRPFLERVFTSPEREAISVAPSPDRSLWTHWAGKEAGYKTVTKALGTPPVFHHSLFQVAVPLELPALGLVQGEVRYQDMVMTLEVHLSPSTLHAVSWFSQGEEPHPACSTDLVRVGGVGEGWQEVVRPRFSPREWGCVTHRGSALTRLAARTALARALGVEEKVVEIGCGPGHPGRRVPLVYLAGEAAAVDLTLSHDGDWAAWAFLNP